MTEPSPFAGCSCLQRFFDAAVQAIGSSTVPIGCQSSACAVSQPGCPMRDSAAAEVVRGMVAMLSAGPGFWQWAASEFGEWATKFGVPISQSTAPGIAKAMASSGGERFGSPASQGMDGPGDWKFVAPHGLAPPMGLQPARGVTVMTPLPLAAHPAPGANAPELPSFRLTNQTPDSRAAAPGNDAGNSRVSYTSAANYRRLGRAKP